MSFEVAFDDDGVLCAVEYIKCKVCGNEIGVICGDYDLKEVIKNNPPECDECHSKEWEYIGIVFKEDEE